MSAERASGAGRWAVSGVRARTTLVATAVVGAVLALSGLAFFAVTRSRIESSIGESAAARLDGIVALVEAGALGDPLPGRDPELLGQVVDGSGVVVAADRLVADVGPFIESGVAVGERSERRVASLFEDVENNVAGLEDEGPYIVLAHGVELPEGLGTVMVAASLEDASEALGAATPVLGVGLPLLLAIVGLTTWILTGRALRPVELMRAEADRISAAALDRRLPVPGSRDEIHRLALTLNAMLERLEAAAMRQRRFVADASHELKSPLAALRTMVEVSEGDLAAAGHQQVAGDLRVEIDRMWRLVNDLLYLAGYDEAEVAVSRQAVDLDQIVRAEAASLSQRFDLRIDSQEVRPVQVLGDPDRLAQLVRNLTDNAARHAGTTIWLETRQDEGGAVLIASDDGPGIPDAERERIFERFVRLDESRTRGTGGAGLGLAVARAIARSHGGDLSAIAPLHGGASFEARLPRGAS